MNSVALSSITCLRVWCENSTRGTRRSLCEGRFMMYLFLRAWSLGYWRCVCTGGSASLFPFHPSARTAQQDRGHSKAAALSAIVCLLQTARETEVQISVNKLIPRQAFLQSLLYSQTRSPQPAFLCFLQSCSSRFPQ